MSLLPKALDLLHIPYTQQQLEQCRIYLHELCMWNKKMNLSGARTVEELEVHVIDSLLGKPHIDAILQSHVQPHPRQVVDLGSGAGFPAIPLAIFSNSGGLRGEGGSGIGGIGEVCGDGDSIGDHGGSGNSEGKASLTTHTQWTLVERSAKRVGFLRVVTALTGLKDCVTVLEQPAEKLVPHAHVVTFRAFRPVQAMYATFQNYLEQASTLVMYKGKRSAIEQELQDFSFALSSQLYSVEHPLIKGERTICVIKPKTSQNRPYNLQNT